MSTIYTQSLALTHLLVRSSCVCRWMVVEWAELLFNTVSYRYKSPATHKLHSRFYGYFGRVNCFQVSHFTYSIPIPFRLGECVDFNILQRNGGWWMPIEWNEFLSLWSCCLYSEILDGLGRKVIVIVLIEIYGIAFDSSVYCRVMNWFATDRNRFKLSIIEYLHCSVSAWWF